MKEKIAETLKNYIPSSGYKSLILSYPVVLFLSICIFAEAFYFTQGVDPAFFSDFPVHDGIWTNDSYEYYRAITPVMSGSPDSIRTPVYPFILGIMMLIGGQVYMFKLAMIFQYIIFVISGIYLYKCAYKITRNTRASFWVMTVYMLLPRLVIYCCFILSDSLGFCGVIFLLWCLIKDYPKTPSIKISVIIGVITLVLIYLRPIFLCLLPVILIYYLLMYWQKKEKSGKGLITWCVMMTLIIGSVAAYSAVIYSNYGIKSMSSITLINQFSAIRQCIGLRPDLAQDQELRQILEGIDDNSLDPYEGFDQLYPYFYSHPLELQDYVERTMPLAKNEFPFLVFRRLIYELPTFEVLPPTKIVPIHFFERVFMPSFAIQLIVLVWAIALWVRQIRKDKKVPILFSLLIMIVGSIIAASIIGSMGEWSRLLMAELPVFMLLTTKICTVYTFNTNKKGLLE